MQKLRRKLDVSLSPHNGAPKRSNFILENKPDVSLWTKIRQHLKWGKSKPPPESRCVWVGQKPPNRSSNTGDEIIKPHKYPSNLIKTSKYTLWNFIPKNLFEQFRRLANFYFLIIAIIQMVLPNSPVSPMTSVLPLVFVVLVTAVKQGYEDWLRHKSDNIVNNKKVTIVKDGREKIVKSKDIKVGDIVLVKINSEFPCDLVLLSSKESSGQCYITTANLDGETNLKIHCCVPETKLYKNPEELETLQAVIDCELPNADLYRFKGRITVVTDDGEKVCPLSQENVLLRGTSLKNTAFIYGCAVYTGQQTKMAMNSKLTSNKFSTIERSMNIYLIMFLMLLIVEVALCAALQYGYHSNSTVPLPWYMYIPSDELNGIWHVLENVLSYIVLLNYTIPISMYVTIELQKFFGSLFFGWDGQLYDEKTDQCAKCNTSDLNEELGQVQYLFTDKTGTLTENDMQFRRCSISATRYIEHDNVLCQFQQEGSIPEPVEEFSDDVNNFFLALALCHTAQVTPKLSRNGSINPGFVSDSDDPDAISLSSESSGGSGPSLPEYQASSPDEKALLEACRRFGIIFRGIEEYEYRITFKGKKQIYKLLHVLEFDSDRKCMSVIVQKPDGKIFLYCKGAETAVLPRADSGPSEETLAHVNEYAMFGLRTLVVGERELSHKDYDEFEKEIRKARASLEDRDKEVAVLFETVERNLTILGATAVEDRLQDGVPETLQALREAGIKIWMLTGDKEETAVNISYSCGHFNRDMVLLYATQQRDGEAAKITLNELKKRMQEDVDCGQDTDFALVVDGASLAYIFRLEFEYLEVFREISCNCKAVVCCRMTPIQKAIIVRLIKKSVPLPTTAAIGDGANDVSMIQEAHVGLGVMGKEGRQAVRCSDFAFARFRFLKRVLLVHGHYYYVRVSMMVQYSFYKNLAFITPQLYYVFYAWFSPQPLYDGMFLTFFNIIFTSAPILIYGLFEQNISQDKLMDQPELYKKIANNSLLSAWQFTKWTALGFWHSIVFFYGALLLFNCDALTPYGWTFDIWCMGTLVFHASVVIINLKLCLETRFYTGIFFFSIVISILGFMGFSLIYCSTTLWRAFSGGTGMLWVYFQLMCSSSFWFCSFVMTVASLAPDMTVDIFVMYSKEIRDGYRKIFSSTPPSNNTILPTNNNNTINELSTRISRRLKRKPDVMSNSQEYIIETTKI